MFKLFFSDCIKNYRVTVNSIRHGIPFLDSVSDHVKLHMSYLPFNSYQRKNANK